MKNLNKDLCGFLIQYFQATILGSIYRMIFMSQRANKLFVKYIHDLRQLKLDLQALYTY